MVFFVPISVLKVEYEYIKSALCRDLRIELAERARRGISRICEYLFTVFLVFGVDPEKRRPRHVYFAAHAEISAVRDLLRQRRNRACVFGDVLTDFPVAARGGTDKFSASVFGGDGKTVDLRLDGKTHAVAERLLHPPNEILKRFAVEYVREASEGPIRCPLYTIYHCAIVNYI